MRSNLSVLKNPVGMTMVEVLVTMGIASVLIMGILQMTNYANKAAKNVQTSSEWSMMATQASLLLQQETHCHESLKGITLSASTSTSLPQGLKFLMNGTTTPVTVAKVDDYGGYTIDKVELKTTGAPFTITTASGPQTLYAAVVEISGKKKGQAIGGTNLKTISIPIQVVTDTSNAIVGCYGKDLASAQACQDLGGKYYPAVPVGTPKCQMAKGKCRNVKASNPCNNSGQTDSCSVKARNIWSENVTATCLAGETATSVSGFCKTRYRHTSSNYFEDEAMKYVYISDLETDNTVSPATGKIQCALNRDNYDSGSPVCNAKIDERMLDVTINMVCCLL